MKAIIRKDEQAVSPVIATILMVAITVVLAAVLYVMVSGLIGGTNTTSKPTITLTVTKITNGASVLVAGIQPTATPSNFKVNIQNATSSGAGTAQAAPTTAGGAGGCTTTTASCSAVSMSDGPRTVVFSITWQNPGGSGTISQGDTFVITYGATKPAAGTSWSFLLIWSDGSVLPTNTNWQV
jgi:flagellin-like protein